MTDVRWHTEERTRHRNTRKRWRTDRSSIKNGRMMCLFVQQWF